MVTLSISRHGDQPLKVQPGSTVPCGQGDLIALVIGRLIGGFRDRSVCRDNRQGVLSAAGSNGEVSGIVGDVVVGKLNRPGLSVCTDKDRCRQSLTSSPAIGRRHAVHGQEPVERAGEHWINRPKTLLAVIRGDRSILLVDSEVRCIVGDGVVGKHTGRAERSR